MFKDTFCVPDSLLLVRCNTLHLKLKDVFVNFYATQQLMICLKFKDNQQFFKVVFKFRKFVRNLTR